MFVGDYSGRVELQGHFSASSDLLSPISIFHAEDSFGTFWSGLGRVVSFGSEIVKGGVRGNGGSRRRLLGRLEKPSAPPSTFISSRARVSLGKRLPLSAPAGSEAAKKAQKAVAAKCRYRVAFRVSRNGCRLVRGAASALTPEGWISCFLLPV